MITEIEGVVINGDKANIVLVDDTEGTIELEMTVEMLDQLRQSISREQSRAEVDKIITDIHSEKVDKQ